MIRDLKALGLALVAVFALGASVASAQQGTLTSDGPVTLTGTETGGIGSNAITLLGVRIECPGSTGTGHKYTLESETTHAEKTVPTHHALIPVGATTFTVTPHIKQANHNCKSSTGWVFTTDFNGCDYVTHIGLTTGGVAGTYGGTTDIVCPPGKEIVWTVFKNATDETNGTVGCVLNVKAQTGLTGGHVTNTPSGHLGITGPVNNIHVNMVKPAGAHIMLCVTQTLANVSFDVDVTVAGHNAAGEKTNIEVTHP